MRGPCPWTAAEWHHEFSTALSGAALAVRGKPFKLFLVEEGQAPGNGVPGTWFRYTISQGDNIITGVRQGSKAAVMLALEETVAALNERRVGRRGKVHLTMSRGRTKKS